METGRLLGDQRGEAAHRTLPGSSALRESVAAATNVLTARKQAAAANRPVGMEINPMMVRLRIV
ncbi:hypothetical protein [Lysinibacillus zambalensis]|uniref:hypothetical protein n=1 Tax=Lysinibacillus zambalensis TaxID=3160866 RepID=UPI0032E371F4